jgi:hypothetical protein
VFDGDPLGFVVAVLFGACTIFSAGRLLISREKLIDLPPSYFFRIAAEGDRFDELAAARLPSDTDR